MATFTTSLVARDLEKPRTTKLLSRGEYNLPVGDPLEPGILTVMGAFLILVGLAAMVSGDENGVGSEARDRCCFTNSRYAGVCVVQPGEGETCGSILDYLNNPASSGKSYCGFTDIRGGWEEVSCEEEESQRPRASVPVQIPDRVGAGPVDDIPSDPTLEEAYPECCN